MRDRVFRAGVCCVLLIALYGINLASGAVPSVTKNCVRLVGDTGSKGRVEITTKDPFLTGGDGSKGAWLPICQTGFDDGVAQDMCELLGFKFGRSYITLEVAYPSKQKYTNAAVYVRCFPKVPSSAGHRRQLRGGDDGAHALAAQSGDMAGSVQHSASRSERSLHFMTYSTSTPKNAPYDCSFFRGTCASSGGAFAGVECSNQPLPPAPSPPPSPPSPPPYTELIRVIGSQEHLAGYLEPNLCPYDAPEGFCQSYGRVELLVDAPSGGGGQIWAPLCGVDEELQHLTAVIACQQAYGWPLVSPMQPIVVYGRAPSEPPYSFEVPTGEVTGPGDFNPAAVTGWATLTGLQDVRPSTLQDGNITISATPCASLFAVRCDVLYARRRQRN